MDSQAKDRIFQVVLWCGFAALFFWSVFKLPFLFPPSQVSSSPAYEAGFNIRVCTLAALGGVLAMLAYGWWTERWRLAPALPVSSKYPLVSTKLVAIVISIYALMFWFFTAGQLATPDYYGDIRYYLDGFIQITKFGRRPYADFDFVYGPLMLYGPIWIHQLPLLSGLSLEACCSLFTFALNVWSLYLLAYYISKIFPSRYANWLYVLLCCAFVPSGGLPNGSLFRYISPFVSLVFLEDLQRRVQTRGFASRAGIIAAYLLCTFLFILLFSPEIGLSYAAGVAALFFFRAMPAPSRDYAPWLAIGLAGAASAVLIASNPVAIYWLRSVAAFSKGGMSFVVVPNFAVVAYLAAVLLCSAAAGGTIRRLRESAQSGPLWLALFAAALFPIPALLGRIMFGHVFLYGLGVFLLAFSVIATRSIHVQRWTTLSVGLLLVAFHLRSIQVDPFIMEAFTLNSLRLTSVGSSVAARLVAAAHRSKIGSGLVRIAEAPPPVVRELPPEIGHEPVATPWGADKITDNTLLQAGVYHPEYYLDFINVALPEAEPVKIAALQECDWALIPKQPVMGTLDLPLVRRLMSYPVSYRSVHQPYVPGKELYAYLLSHYHAVVETGGYRLFRRNSEGS